MEINSAKSWGRISPKFGELEYFKRDPFLCPWPHGLSTMAINQVVYNGWSQSLIHSEVHLVVQYDEKIETLKLISFLQKTLVLTSESANWNKQSSIESLLYTIKQLSIESSKWSIYCQVGISMLAQVEHPKNNKDGNADVTNNIYNTFNSAAGWYIHRQHQQ